MYRDVYFQCETFIECGFTFKASLSILSTLNPSRQPNPKIRLPLDEVHKPANDDRPGNEIGRA